MPEAGQLQVELTETGVPSAVWVVTPNGRFTIAAYAAPKTGSLWREVAAELADSLRKDSAAGQHRGRPVGPRGGRHAPPGWSRFIGVDGYRWMIRCVDQRPARDHRGAGPGGARRRWRTPWFAAVTPRCRCATPLPVQLPEPMADQLRQAAVQQAEAQQERLEQTGAQPTRNSRRRAGRAPQRAGIGHAAAAHHHRRLARPRNGYASAERGQAGRARAPRGPRPSRSSVTVRSAARGAAATHSMPTSTRMHRIVDRGGHPHRNGQAVASSSQRWRDVAGRFVHGVGQRGHWPTHDRVSSSASQGGLDARIWAVAAASPSRAQLVRRMPRRQRGRRRPGWPGPGRQRGQHGDACDRDGPVPTRLPPRHRSTPRRRRSGPRGRRRPGRPVAVDQPVRAAAPGSPAVAPTSCKAAENAR